MNISISKKELLEVLKTNRDKHESYFAESWTGYNEKLKLELRKMLRQIDSSDDPFQVHISLPVPQSHLSDYDRVIRMVEHDTRAELLLEEDEARRYLDDDWDWQRGFKGMMSLYNTKFG